MVGRDAARLFGLLPGSTLTLRYAGRDSVAYRRRRGDAGGAEDSQMFVNLAAAQDLAA